MHRVPRTPHRDPHLLILYMQPGKVLPYHGSVVRSTLVFYRRSAYYSMILQYGMLSESYEARLDGCPDPSSREQKC